MASPLARGRAAVDELREHNPFFDHVVRTLRHYSRVNGSGLAGSVTFYAFLSFFPILALAFFVVGIVSRVWTGAEDNLVDALSTALPHMVGRGQGEIRMSTIEDAAGTAGLIGGVGLLYSGLGWLSGMRTALEQVFELPRSEYPSFVAGKLRDLVSLVAIGVTLLGSVALSALAIGFSDDVLDWVGLGGDLAWLVDSLAVVVGLGANTLLFFTLFSLLARPPTPRRSLWQGAVVGAIGFEILKLGSGLLLTTTRGKPAFQALGVALILLIWINYFSRVVMYAAAWAHTSAAARAERELRHQESTPPRAAEPEPLPAGSRSGRARLDPRVAFGAGAAAALGLVALLRRRRD
jgi:membrane protein